MPRFYFDIRDGTGFAPDQEGIEFDSLIIFPEASTQGGLGGQKGCPV